MKTNTLKSEIVGSSSVLINATPSKVWEALTKPEIIKQYFFGTDTVTDWKVGHPIVFKGEWQGKSYEDKGTVLDFQPDKLLSYSYWSSMSGMEDKPENYARVAYQLAEQSGQTKLIITQNNIPDEETKEHSESNWKKVLDGLKSLLEKKH